MTLSVPDLGLCRLKCHPDIQLVVDYQMYRFVRCTVFSCTLQLVFFHHGYFEQKHTSGLVDTFLTICSTKLLQKLSSIYHLFTVQILCVVVCCQHWHNSHHNHFTCMQPLLSVLDTASESHTPGGPGKESATDMADLEAAVLW